MEKFNMREHLIEDLIEARGVLSGFLAGEIPCMGIILGSGLNPFADCLENPRYLTYEDVPHLEVSTAEGHVGRFVLGKVPGTDKKVLCMQGRLHGYEGYSAQQVAFPVWLMRQVGIETLITTNAAGAINPAFKVGDFCLMSDHINLTGRNPVCGVEADKIAQRFVPMLGAYDPALRALVHRVADEEKVMIRDGVYLGLLGPSFETPAEIRAFAAWGADTVAMSVVEEVIAARHVGMRVAGLSLVSNMACGIAGSDPTSDEVMDVSKRRVDAFIRLISGVVREA